MKEYQESSVEFTEISSPIMQKILSYIYTGSIEINVENAIEILVSAKKLFLDDELCDFLINFVEENLIMENVIEILDFSKHFQFDFLSQKCLSFILENFEEAYKQNVLFSLDESEMQYLLSNLSFHKLNSEFEVFEVILKWAQKQLNLKPDPTFVDPKSAKSIEDKIKNLILQIRFCEMEKKEIETIQKMNIIEKNMMEDIVDFEKSENNQYKLYEKYKEKNYKIFIPRNPFKRSVIFQDKLNLLNFMVNSFKNKSVLKNLKLVYVGSQDGFEPQIFHEKCDGKGRTFVIIKTKEDYIFGIYTKVGWTADKSKWRNGDKGDTGWIPDPDALIFTLVNADNQLPAIFHVKEDEYENALYYSIGDGPSIGKNNGFDIGIRGKNFYDCWSCLGNGYNAKERFNSDSYNGMSQKHLAGKSSGWAIEEMEVFCGEDNK
eukprot:Anaeramoba_ignava/a92730_24.p1 GENE.a92730_24~~a92730_24.p1  ORF type:complete len:452 (-),score=161.12 a92730_24:64-1362(-)